MTSALSSAAGSLASLLGQTAIDDHEELLQAADATLAKSKNDLEAQHVKVVALLKLDRYEDAIRALDNGGDKLKERARLEWAYALYKTGDPAKAAQVSKDGAERGMRHVEAQANYRVENFKRASELYAQLAEQKSQVSNEELDLKINGCAVDAQLEWANLGDSVKNKKPGREDLEAFETAYNAACGSIARGELGQADVLLKRSRDLCNASDELSDEDKKAELLPIAVQQVYVTARLGRREEAHKISEQVNPADLTDSSSKQIARVNSIAVQENAENVFSIHRIVHKAPESLVPNIPFGFQSTVMNRNNYAADLLAQKYPGTVRSTVAAISSRPAPNLDPTTNSLSVINAAAHARNQAGKEALKTVLPELEKRPNDLGLVLVILQLYVLAGNVDAATTLLEKFLDRLSESSSSSELEVRYAPGLVGTLVSLYSARNQSTHIRKELAKAAKYWRQRSKEEPSPKAVTHLLKTAGGALLESDEKEDQTLAAEIFTDLSAQDPNDRYTSAGLIAAQSLSNPSSINSSQLTTLTPVERLISGIDVSALEEAGIARSATAPAPTSNKRAAPGSLSAPKKSKKIKPSRLPKDYDPNKKPDPERWLPLKDRSTYRPKGKKGKARQAMLTQGGPVADDKDKDSRPSTPGVEKAQVAKGKQQKKKGKGGKW